MGNGPVLQHLGRRHVRGVVRSMGPFSQRREESERPTANELVVLIYMCRKERSLGLSSGRPAKVTTKLPGRTVITKCQGTHACVAAVR